MVAVTHQGLLEKLLLAVLIHKRVLYITENNHWRKLNHNILDSTTKGKSCDHTMQTKTHFSKIYQYLCLAQKMLQRTWAKIARIMSVYSTTFILEQRLPLSVTHIYWQQLPYSLNLAVGVTRSQINILNRLETPWQCEINATSGCDALM